MNSVNRQRKTPRRRRASFYKGIKTCARWTIFLLLFAAFVSFAVVYRRGADELRNVASRILQEQFPNVQTNVQTVRLDSTRGVRLGEVSWRRAEDASDASPLLEAEEIYVECPVDVRSFLAGKFQPRKIVVRRPRLVSSADPVVLLSDLQSLRPKRSDSAPCVIEITDAALTFVDGKDETTVSGVKLSLTPSFDPPEASAPTAPTEGIEPSTQENAPEEEKDTQASKTKSPVYTALDSQIRIRPINYEEPQNAEAPGLAGSTQGETNVDASASSAPRWKIDVEISNPYVESIVLSGEARDDFWSLNGSIAKLDLAPFLTRFGTRIPKEYSFLRNLQGKTSLDLKLSGSFSELAKTKYQADGLLLNGAVVVPILKYPLSDLEIRYFISNDSIEVERLTARCGSSNVKAAYRQLGVIDKPDSSAFRVKLENFPLDDETLVRLATDGAQSGAVEPEKIQSFLNFITDYQFTATTNVDATVEKSPETNGNWTPTNLAISGRNVEFVYRQFPYRLDRLEGVVSIDRDETFTIDLHSSVNDSLVKIDGKFKNALSSPSGQVLIESQGRAIDAKLLGAVPESCQEVLTALRPSGALDAKLLVSYDPHVDPDDPLKIQTRLDVRDGSIQYALFPLPISSISGTIYMREDVWLFSNLVGKSGAASLNASGSLASGRALTKLADVSQLGAAEFDDEDTDGAPAPLPLFASTSTTEQVPPLDPDAWRFQLTTDVQNFPLGEELRNALIKYEKKDDFEKLRLEGKADGQIRIVYRTDVDKLGLEFEALPKSQATSAQPVGFPVELKDLEGRVVFRDGTLQIDNLRARSGKTTFSANLQSQTIPNVGWFLDLTSLRVDQFQVDRDLQSAASNQALTFLNFLNPSGFFNVDGSLRVFKGLDPRSKLQATWALRLVAQQNAARPGVQLDAICGAVKLIGSATESSPPVVYGEFDLDSLYCKDLQICRLHGPFYYNGVDLFWGREAPAIRHTPLYQDPFLRSRIDADPAYRLTQTFRRPTRSQTFRAQSSDVPPGFQSMQPDVTKPETPASSAGLTTTEDGRRPVRADVFQGAVVSDGVFYGREAPAYRLAVDIQNGALEDVSRYFAPGSKPLKGRVAGYVSLQGEGKNVATLKGDGLLKIQEAELYELPQIVKIFQLLSVQNPDQSAFNTASVRFEVVGDRLKLTRVLLEGAALTLFGDGWITIREQEKLIDLTLNSRLGNASTQIPIISDVIGGVGDQLAQIRVEGDLKSPVIQQEGIPGVKKAWWSVFPEQEPEPTDKAPVGRARPIRDAWRKLTGAEKE